MTQCHLMQEGGGMPSERGAVSLWIDDTLHYNEPSFHYADAAD